MQKAYNNIGLHQPVPESQVSGFEPMREVMKFGHSEDASWSSSNPQSAGFNSPLERKTAILYNQNSARTLTKDIQA